MINSPRAVTTKNVTAKKVPKLRFRGFNDEWQNKRLGDIAQFFKGKNISKDDVIADGRIEAIRYGELYTRYGEVIKEVYSRVNITPTGLVFSRSNDVLLPSSGETSIDIATASCVLKDGVALGGDITIVRAEANGVFLAYYLSHSKKHDIARLAQGNSVVHLYSSGLKSLLLCLPRKEEQKRIVELMEAIENKVAALKAKKGLLRKYKKSVMRAIFTQNIRFKDESDDSYPEWQAKKLGEVFERVVERNKKDNRNVLTISAQQGLVAQEEFFSKVVAAKDVSSYYLLKRGDFAYNKSYSKDYPMGAIKVLNNYKEGVVSTLYLCFRVKSGHSGEFFEHYFNSGLQNREIEKVAQEGARNHGLLNIGIYDFFNIQLFVPSEPEQQRVADFLNYLDDKINLTGKELERAKAFRKALVQQMLAV